MLEAIMDITFFNKTSPLFREWAGYNGERILRPTFNLGGILVSGNIISDEKMYYWDRKYTVLVDFFTVDTPGTYPGLESKLFVGGEYDIQLASKVIGKAIMIDYCFYN